MESRIRRLTTLSAVALVVLALLTTRVPAQQREPLQAAFAALGTANLRTVHMAGFGATYAVGQSPNPRGMSPRVTLKAYEADIDYTVPRMRVLLVREIGPVPPRDGGPPVAGEQRVLQFLNGGDAWDLAVPAAPGGAPSPAGAAVSAPASSVPPEPHAQPQAVAERTQQILATPHGFLKAARAHDATTRAVPHGAEVSFTAAGRRYVGLINARNEVDRVQTWLDRPVRGDILVETLYRDYEKGASGVAFPRHITQSQGGFVALDVWLSAVVVNPPVEIVTPDAVMGAVPPAQRLEAGKTGPGGGDDRAGTSERSRDGLTEAAGSSKTPKPPA